MHHTRRFSFLLLLLLVAANLLLVLQFNFGECSPLAKGMDKKLCSPPGNCSPAARSLCNTYGGCSSTRGLPPVGGAKPPKTSISFKGSFNKQPFLQSPYGSRLPTKLPLVQQKAQLAKTGATKTTKPVTNNKKVTDLSLLISLLKLHLLNKSLQ